MADTSRFKLTRQQLTDLMDFRDRGDRNSIGKLEEMGGIVQISADLDANLKEGLSKSTEEIETRMKVFGCNHIDPIPPKSFLALVLDALQDKVLIILICAALVSVVISEVVASADERATAWVEGAAILLAVVLVVMVTAVNDWTKERKFWALQQKLACSNKYTVIRDGQRFELPTADIVVGDLVEFKYGNTFPCDGLLIEGSDVRVSEASLTGESEQLKKTPEKNPFLYAGTQVMEGAGSMIAVAVGPYSQQGIIFQLLTQNSGEEAGFITQAIKKCIRRCRHVPEGAEELKELEAPSSESVLQKKLARLALRIGYMAIAAAILSLIITTVKFSIITYGIDGESASGDDALQFLNFFITAITVVVVAVPEGLPLAVTIALAFSVQKMLKDNNLVRHLHCCETMGNATCICSDKTGTLTTNRMTVVDTYIAGRRYTDTYPIVADIPRLIVEVMQQNIAVNSSYSSKLEPPRESDGEGRGLFSWLSKLRIGRGRKSKAEDEQELIEVITDDRTLSLDDLLPREGHLPSQIGNVTECALLGLLVQLGINYEVIRSEYPRETIVKQFTFNAVRKSMSTVIPLPRGGYRLLTKGASEIVLDKCTHIIDNDGDSVELTEEMKEKLKLTVVQNMASNALRTLCLAYRDFPSENNTDKATATCICWEDEKNVVSHLTCIAIVGIQDPVRPEVAESIRLCQLAGITVRMVTGDNIETARAIAEKCGIIKRGDRRALVMEGKVFKRRVTGKNNEVIQNKVDRIWPRLRVLARSSPQDKYILVDGIIRSELNKNREVVAVTGDGTNDGPALKRADVGFAMGIAGTDVAKQASDIILTDDNFTSIVKAVKWGRNIYDAISKFLQFQLTVNVVAVLLVLVGSVLIGTTPLRAIQLLWVNLVMDTLGSLALATESPTPELLKRAPYGRNQALLSRRMILFILGHSVYQLTVLVTLLVAGDMLFDIDKADALDHFAPPTEHLTIIFNTFVLMQLFNEINARKVHGEPNVFKGIHRNFIFIGVMVVQIVLQIVWIEVPYVNSHIFATTPLSLDLWLWCVFLGSVELVWGQIIQLIPVEKFPKINMPCFHDEPEPLEEFDPQVSWMKLFTRLRMEIRVVNAFKAGLESDDGVHVSRLPLLHSTPHLTRHYGAELCQHETGV